MTHGLGRKPSPPDSRDYKLARYLDGFPDFAKDSKVWKVGGVLDQGSTPHCCGFAGTHWQNAEPVLNNIGDPSGHQLYYLCKIFDGEPGEENGSYIRTVGKALKKMGRLDEYAFGTVFEARKFLLTQGPVVCGVDWYEDMRYPEDGIIRPTGSYCGGHAILAYAADPDWCYLQNSWGEGWGTEGHCRISWPDLEFAFGEHGEAMVGIETPLDWQPPVSFWARLWHWFLRLLGR